MPYGFNSDADDDDVNVNTCNKILTSKGHPKWYIEQISHCVSFIVLFQVCACGTDQWVIFDWNIHEMQLSSYNFSKDINFFIIVEMEFSDCVL